MDFPSLADSNPKIERFCTNTIRKYESNPYRSVSRIHPDELPQKMKDLLRNPDQIKEIVGLINTLYVLGVEPRSLFLIRTEFERKDLEDGAIPKEHFVSLVKTAFKGNAKETL